MMTMDDYTQITWSEVRKGDVLMHDNGDRLTVEDALEGTRELPDVGTRIRTDHNEPHLVRVAALRNRLLSRYIIPIGRTQCWLWQGALEPDGYSRILWGKRRIGGHRASYMAFIADVPDGLVIDHLCRNHSCVNPWHLEPVTNHENMMRGVGIPAINARKTHCKRGHAFDGSNTRVVIGGDGIERRECKTCHRRKVARLTRTRKERATDAVMALLNGEGNDD